MNRIVLLMAFLVGCVGAGAWDPGIDWNPNYHADGEDEALELLRELVEAQYDVEVPAHSYEVRWTDTPCPHAPTRKAVVWDDGCYYGLTFGCTMYVAESPRAGDICGTALLHEYGHCLRAVLGWKDNDHDDVDYWEFIHGLGPQFCE